MPTTTSPLTPGSIVAKRYGEFVEQLPELKKNTQLGEDELTFADYVSLLIGWLKTERLETFRQKAVGLTIS